MAFMNFYTGTEANYNSTTHQNSIYLTSDTHKLIFNGNAYGDGTGISGNYLPLTGGTMNGNINFNIETNRFIDIGQNETNKSGYYTPYIHLHTNVDPSPSNSLDIYIGNIEGDPTDAFKGYNGIYLERYQTISNNYLSSIYLDPYNTRIRVRETGVTEIRDNYIQIENISDSVDPTHIYCRLLPTGIALGDQGKTASDLLNANGGTVSISSIISQVNVPTKVSDLTNDSNFQTSSQVTTTVNNAINALVNGAPEAMDTLKELADALNDQEDAVAAINSTLATKVTTISASGTSPLTLSASKSGTTVTITGSVATVTTTAAGLMSASDKSKLDGIASGANAYTHPTYTSRSSGLYKITVDGTGHVSAVTSVTKADITALGIPGQDTNTTYGNATTSAAGLMSSSDKSKLDGIRSGATAVNFSRSLSSGVQIGTITINGTDTILYAPQAGESVTYDQATSSTLGLIRIGYTENGKNYPVELDSNGRAYVNVPWTDTNTTYSLSSLGGVGTVNATGSNGVNISASKSGTTVSITSSLSLRNTTKSSAASTYTAGVAGKFYAVQLDTNGYPAVYVPWTDTNTTYSNATSSAAGLMSASDKAKLDGIDSNANNYSLPAASSTTRGGILLGYTENGKNYPVEVDSNGKAYVNVPWVDTNDTTVTVAEISDLNSGWDSLLKAAPSTYVTRWPTISEVTGKQNLSIQLNGGTATVYNGETARSINITASAIGAAASSHTHNYLPLSGGTLTGPLTIQGSTNRTWLTVGDYTQGTNGNGGIEVGGSRGYTTIEDNYIGFEGDIISSITPHGFTISGKTTNDLLNGNGGTTSISSILSSNNLNSVVTDFSNQGATCSLGWVKESGSTSPGLTFTFNLPYSKSDGTDDYIVGSARVDIPFASMTQAGVISVDGYLGAINFNAVRLAANSLFESTSEYPGVMLKGSDTPALSIAQSTTSLTLNFKYNAAIMGNTGNFSSVPVELTESVSLPLAGITNAGIINSNTYNTIANFSYVSSGNTGINTISAQTVHFRSNGTGTILASITSGSANATDSFNIQAPSGFAWFIGRRGGTRTIKFGSNDHVAFGSSTSLAAPTSAWMSVNGTIQCTGVDDSSDERIKENIASISDDKLEKIANVEIKTFNFKENDDKRVRYGVIAQEVEAAGLEELVITETANTDLEGGLKSVNYNSIFALKIRMLEKKIEELTQKIENLTSLS